MVVSSGGKGAAVVVVNAEDGWTSWEIDSPVILA